MSPVKIITTQEAEELVTSSKTLRHNHAESVAVTRIDAFNDVLGFFAVLHVSGDAAIVIRREPTAAERRAAEQAEAAERNRQAVLARLRAEEAEASRERPATNYG